MLIGPIDFAEDRPLAGYSSGGEIYFSVGDHFFPAENWYDCLWQDLQTWLPGLISFGSSHTDSCELIFMDGPYTIRLFRREDGAICADFLREQKQIDSQMNVDLRTLLKSILSCCRKYDRFLHENWKTNQFHEEIKTLRQLLDT